MKRECEEKQSDTDIHLTRRTFDPKTEPPLLPSNKRENYIVQFKKSLTGTERQRLRTQFKLALDQYVPNLAFLERLDFNTVVALSHDPLHRASVLFQPQDKISPEIDSRERDGLLLRALLFPKVSEEEIVIAVKAVKDLLESVAPTNHYCNREENQRYRKNGAAQQFPTNGDREDGFTIEPEPSEVRVFDDRKEGGEVELVFILPSLNLLPPIASLDQVQWIEEVVESDPDSTTTTTSVGTNTITGTIQSGAPTETPLWDIGIYGTGQRIGIIDHTVVDVKHCMFKDEPGIEFGNGHRKVVGFRPLSYLSNNDHGTAAASIAGGDEINNSGANADRGIAWDAKIAYDDKKSISSTRTLLQLLQNQLRDQVLTHSNSWHDRTILYNKNARSVDCFVWENEDHFVCGSAGNSALGELLGPPGTAKNALCVSASEAHPNQLQHGDGQVGPTRDSRRKPEICAPGAGIRAADAGSGCGYLNLTDPQSSFATPVIAGAAALVRQYYLEGFYPAGTRDVSRSLRPSGALIKASLLNSTVPMEDPSDYPNNRTGWGLVELDNTLFLPDSPRRLFVADVRKSEGLLTDESQVHEIYVNSDAQPLKITLVWSDPPAGLFAAGTTLINNLDLVVTSPDGYSTYLGNREFDEGFSLPAPPGTRGDDLNNVEMVIIEEPDHGVWTITVKGVAVNFERQGYAVVATGSLELAESPDE